MGKKFFKKMIFNLFLKFPDEVIVNSLDLKRKLIMNLILILIVF